MLEQLTGTEHQSSHHELTSITLEHEHIELGAERYKALLVLSVLWLTPLSVGAGKCVPSESERSPRRSLLGRLFRAYRCRRIALLLELEAHTRHV